MGRGVGDRAGGILGLFRLLTEHEGAIRYDLLSLGLRLDDLGTKRLTWVDLLAVLTNLPPGSAVARARHGEFATWTAETHLLALIADVLRAANWQRASKGPRPKPVPRPKDPAQQQLSAAALKKDHMRSGVIGQPAPFDEMKRWLEAKNGR